MINISDAFVRLLNYKDYSETTGVKLLYVFSGTVPTKEQLAEIAALDTEGSLTSANVLSWASQNGSVLLQANAYASDLVPVYPNKKLTQWPLSERTEEFKYYADGTVGWFMFGVTGSNTDVTSLTPATLQALDTELLTSAFGTAGDEESEADLGILTGELDGNKEYSSTDLELFYI